MSATTGSAFFFDLASPLAYLAAEQALPLFAGAPEPIAWTPVLAAELPGGGSLVFRCEAERDALIEDVTRRAAQLGLQPLRWPEPFPFDSGLAMRVATYARSIGRAVPFAQAAFRQAFAGGRALDDEDSVVIAAAACEMHPAAVLQGAALRSTAQQLEQATARAREAGVTDVPAVLARGRVFHGERELASAAEWLAAGGSPPAGSRGDAGAFRAAGEESGPR